MESDHVELAVELQKCMELDDSGNGFISHPLVVSLGYDSTSGEQTRMLNDWLEKKRKAVQQAVEEKDWCRVIMLYEKPYRLRALSEHGPAMPDEVYFHHLGQIWMEVENVWQHRNDIPHLLSPPGRDLRKRSLMMSPDDQAVLEGLPEIVTIYRGCGPMNEQGWSWTLDEEQAEWFAQRVPGSSGDLFGGLVLIAECQRSAIIAYLSGRGEDEIIIDPRDATVIGRSNVRDAEEPDEVAVEAEESGGETE